MRPLRSTAVCLTAALFLLLTAPAFAMGPRQPAPAPTVSWLDLMTGWAASLWQGLGDLFEPPPSPQQKELGLPLPTSPSSLEGLGGGKTERDGGSCMDPNGCAVS
jgi:hypothetical protein